MNQLTEEIRKFLEENSSFEGIWGKIRSMLVSYYGEDGKAIDQNWFSKLEQEINVHNG